MSNDDDSEEPYVYSSKPGVSTMYAAVERVLAARLRQAAEVQRGDGGEPVLLEALDRLHERRDGRGQRALRGAHDPRHLADARAGKM